MMKYRVIARDWSDALAARFGARGTVHELSAEQVVTMIDAAAFGRAEIRPERDGDEPLLDFQNDYD